MIIVNFCRKCFFPFAYKKVCQLLPEMNFARCTNVFIVRFWRKPRHNFPVWRYWIRRWKVLPLCGKCGCGTVFSYIFCENVCSSVRQIPSIHCSTGRHGKEKLESKVRKCLFVCVNRIGIKKNIIRNGYLNVCMGLFCGETWALKKFFWTSCVGKVRLAVVHCANWFLLCLLERLVVPVGVILHGNTSWFLPN